MVSILWPDKWLVYCGQLIGKCNVASEVVSVMWPVKWFVYCGQLSG